MTSTQVSVTALYAELNKAIHTSDYRNALKAANKILHNKESKDDIEAKHCKVVCLIEIGNFTEALKFINSLNFQENELAFEKAYCQYRLLQSKEALETLREVKKPDLRLLELKAQVLYKLGKYSESLTIYKQLLKECADDFEEERMTNLSAVHGALSAFDGVKTDMGFKPETHEQLFNKSCWLLGQKKFKDAEKTLKRAEEACRSLFDDDPDMTEEEKEAELSVIRVQIAYAIQCQGKNEEALQLYNQVLRSNPNDIALAAVASNNIISINKDQNVFDSRKKIRATTVNGIENKLVPFQKEKIDYNRALLLMYGNQWELCRKLLSNLHREYSSEIPSMIQTALLCREKNVKKAIEYLQEYIERYSDPDIMKFDLTNLQLTLVQLLLSQGELDKASAILEDLEKLRFSPAIVSCLVSLYKLRSNSVESVAQLMDKAVNWHKQNKSSTVILKSLLWEYSQFLLKQNFPQAAAKTLENLLRLDSSDVKVLAQLIFAYSQFNTEKAHQVSEDLPSLEELSVRVDVDELEKCAVLLAPRYVKKQKDKKETPSVAEKSQIKKDVVSEATAATIEIKKRKKKKKKNPTPKDFQPNFVPDPERWIPLRERSYYKTKKKDKRRAQNTVGRGTQGTYVGSGEHTDLASKPTQAPSNTKQPVASTTPNTTPVNSPKPTATKNPKGKMQKKKRKGKW